MLGLSPFHGVETKAKPILSLHVLGVGRYKMTNGPDCGIYIKENGICSKVVCAEGFQFTQVSELKTLCTNYFRANAIFFYVNPTVWTIGHDISKRLKRETQSLKQRQM